MKLALFGAGVALLALAGERAMQYFAPSTGALGAWGGALAAGAVAGIVIHHI